MTRGGAYPSRVLMVMIALGVANHTALAGLRVTISLDALKLGASPFTVGVLMALFALLPMFCAVATGRLSDRVGVRRPMLIGSLGVALGAFLPFVWPGLPALFFSAAIVGLSFMVVQLVTQRVTGDIGKPSDRVINFGLLALGYSVSGFIGPLVAGLSIDHFGYSTAFAVSAGVALLPVVLLAGNRLALPGPQPVAELPQYGGVRALLLHAPLRGVLAINALLAACWDVYQVFLPIYGTRLGLSASEIGTVLAAFGAATFIIRLLMPVIARRRNERQVLTATLLTSGAAFLLFPLSQSALALAVLSFVLGFGLGAGQPMVMSLLHTHAPAGRIGEVVGVRMSLMNSTSVAVPLLFGAVGSSLGLAPIFWSFGVCLTASGIAMRRGGRPPRR